MRKCAISPQRANMLGAHAVEAENQIDFALMALERGDIKSARERLNQSREHCEIIRKETYWDDHERGTETSHSPI